MNIRELVLIKAVSSFENIGFMEWHARVLNVLTPFPQSVREIARKTGLFHYHVRDLALDLLALQLVEYTRHGLQLSGDWEMLLQLVSCCEDEAIKKSFDYEAAFEVVSPRVMALEKRYTFEGE